MTSGSLLQVGRRLIQISQKSPYRQCLPHPQVHRHVAVVCRPMMEKRDIRSTRRAGLSQRTMCRLLRAVIVSGRPTQVIQGRRLISRLLSLGDPRVSETHRRLQARRMRSLGVPSQSQIPVGHEAAVHEDLAMPAHLNGHQRSRASSNERTRRSLGTRAKVQQRRIPSALIIRHPRTSLLQIRQWIQDWMPVLISNRLSRLQKAARSASLCSATKPSHVEISGIVLSILEVIARRAHRLQAGNSMTVRSVRLMARPLERRPRADRCSTHPSTIQMLRRRLVRRRRM